MIRLLKTGLDHIMSGNAIIGNPNLVVYPMTSSWSTSYNNSAPPSNHYLFNDAGSNPVGFPLAITVNYNGVDTSSSGNYLELKTTGLDTTAPTATIATENSSTADEWLVKDVVAGVDIGYLDVPNLAASAFQAGLNLQWPDQVIGEQRVNSGTSYVFSAALIAIYSGLVTSPTDILDLVILKKTAGSASVDDIIHTTQGQTITQLLANGFTMVSQNNDVTGDIVGTSSASIELTDQQILLPGITETEVVVLLCLKTTNKEVVKVLTLDQAVSEYLILDNTDYQDELVLL